MPSEIKELNSLPPTIAYARLLGELHRLIGEGKGDSEEAEAISDQGDGPWQGMTRQKQSRRGDLATDLNVLRDGGLVPAVMMAGGRRIVQFTWPTMQIARTTSR